MSQKFRYPRWKIAKEIDYQNLKYLYYVKFKILGLCMIKLHRWTMGT